LKPSLKVVAGPTVREQVAQKLRGAIASGEFHPGERLVERRLCELTGVSRPSVREALRELERDGLITIVPNRGPIVSVVTEDQARSIYEVRAVLEALTVRLFAERATDAQLAELDEVAGRLGEAYASKDPKRLFTAKDEFYHILLEGAQNEAAMQMLRSIHTRVSQLRMTSLEDPSRVEQSSREIARIVAAICARKAQEAARLCTVHVNNAGKTALAIIRRRSGASQARHSGL
jgi:DNA-binding GntR family transcriptional regulator